MSSLALSAIARSSSRATSRSAISRRAIASASRQLDAQDRHGRGGVPDATGDAQRVDRPAGHRVAERPHPLERDPRGVGAHRDRGVADRRVVVVPALGQGDPPGDDVPAEPTGWVGAPSVAERCERSAGVAAAAGPVAAHGHRDRLQGVDLGREIVVDVVGVPDRLAHGLDEPRPRAEDVADCEVDAGSHVGGRRLAGSPRSCARSPRRGPGRTARSRSPRAVGERHAVARRGATDRAR